jgi:divalent metal cation (Fe/Co/Zn/Cd) transporter
LDGVEPEVIDTIRHGIEHVTGVDGVSAIRARWLGHRLYVEVTIRVEESCSVRVGQAIAEQVKVQLHNHISYLGQAEIRIGC